jgi:hypothetical protein
MDNNWRKKREIQHDAHNRKPGRAEFWKQLKSRRSRRHVSRINEWRVKGKLETTFDDNNRPWIFKDRKKPPLVQTTVITFADYLTDEQQEALKRYRD